MGELSDLNADPPTPGRGEREGRKGGWECLRLQCNFRRVQKDFQGNSLAVQWLGLLRTSSAGAWVRSLLRELRSRKPHGAAKKNKKDFQEVLKP